MALLSARLTQLCPGRCSNFASKYNQQQEEKQEKQKEQVKEEQEENEEDASLQLFTNLKSTFPMTGWGFVDQL